MSMRINSKYALTRINKSSDVSLKYFKLRTSREMLLTQNPSRTRASRDELLTNNRGLPSVSISSVHQVRRYTNVLIRKFEPSQLLENTVVERTSLQLLPLSLWYSARFGPDDDTTCARRTRAPHDRVVFVIGNPSPNLRHTSTRYGRYAGTRHERHGVPRRHTRAL